jgi:hypothetical protein
MTSRIISELVFVIDVVSFLQHGQAKRMPTGEFDNGEELFAGKGHVI